MDGVPTSADAWDALHVADRSGVVALVLLSADETVSHTLVYTTCISHKKGSVPLVLLWFLKTVNTARLQCCRTAWHVLVLA